METTYTMIGADGAQYGPISLEQLKAWVNEGRVTGDMKIMRSDTNSWLRASQYVELGLSQAPATAAAPAMAAPPQPAQYPQPLPQPMTQDPILLRRVQRAAGWFFFIAVLSVLNTFMAMSHAGTYFLVGLGVYFITQNLVVNLVASGAFALFGVFARQGHGWSFIAGMILYALDGVVFYRLQLWLPLAFHAYGLFRIGAGLKANLDLKAQRR